MESEAVVMTPSLFFMRTHLSATNETFINMNYSKLLNRSDYRIFS